MDVKSEGLPKKASAFHEQLTEDREEGGRSFHSAIKERHPRLCAGCYSGFLAYPWDLT